MINSNLQLFSWIISLFIGFIYYFILNYIYIRLNFKNIFLKLIIDIFYIFITFVILSYIYYKINNGVIHYGYPIFYVIGYYLANRVNICVKRLKKAIFLKNR